MKLSLQKIGSILSQVSALTSDSLLKKATGAPTGLVMAASMLLSAILLACIVAREADMCCKPEY